MSEDKIKKIRLYIKANWTWDCIGFGLLYWVLESIRDVFVFGKGSIIHRVFYPDPMSFWMRLLVVLILFLYSIYTQSLINKRKRVEDALRANEKRFRNMIENNADGVIVLDRDGNVNFVNPAAEMLLDCEAKELIGNMFGFPIVVSESTEIEIVRRRGEITIAEMRVVDIVWEGKTAFLVSIRDITKHKQIEKAMKEANEKLRKLDQLKRNFLSTVSHELRTPIAIMREGISLCLDGVVGEITEPQSELLTHTLENTDRLTVLVNDILDISKLEAGKDNLKRSSVDLCTLVVEIKSDFEERAIEKGIRLMTDLPDGMVNLYADREKVIQIFNNLIINALNFTEEGGQVTIKLEEKKDVIECSISDTGIGIAEEDISRLFSKFEQFGRVDGPGYKGTGLGLSIVKGLVGMHGGKVWVESELGKGSTFRFTLKKVPFPKILIVDDERPIIDIVKKFLKIDSYRFIEALNGQEAIAKAHSERVSLIILDMKLPDMSGYEVIGRLKQDAKTHDIPIIIHSGYSVDEKRLDQIKSHKAIPIITKPFCVAELSDKVRQVLID